MTCPRPTKVVVFQCPPLAPVAPGHNAAPSLVEAPVSSMKTSRSGSGWAQARATPQNVNPNSRRQTVDSSPKVRISPAWASIRCER